MKLLSNIISGDGPPVSTTTGSSEQLKSNRILSHSPVSDSRIITHVLNL
jgi:hypothetical protein